MSVKNKAILTVIVMILILVGFLYLYMSLPTVQQQVSHWKSETIGLNRTITLYNNDGKPIKTWTGRVQVEIQGGAARFILGGKAIIIAGTYVIEEN